MINLYNRKPIVGLYVVEDGETMYNGSPVFGVYEVDNSVYFEDSQYVLGADVLDTEMKMHNMQPVRGVVLIEDGRRMYNNRRVVPAFAVTGSFKPSPEPDPFSTVMTAGFVTGGGPDMWGFSDGNFEREIGSLSIDTIGGYGVGAIFNTYLSSSDQYFLQVYIYGDAREDFDGKSVWIDGVQYTPDGATDWWNYVSSVDVTIYEGVTVPSPFEDGRDYLIEIKEHA